MKKEIVESYLRTLFMDVEAEDKFWNYTAICKPLIQENRYINNDSIKVKVNGVTFRYKRYGNMPCTKTYQVCYKLLKH